MVIVLLAGCGMTGRESTTALEADTVFTVGNRRVSLPEWYLYALPLARSYERMYGIAIWDYTLDGGGAMSDAVREEIWRQITYVKIVSDRAAEYDISLNEDEILELNLRTTDYYESLDPDVRDRYGITVDAVRDVYRDNMLAMKVYEELTLNVDMTVPEDDVRHMVLQYVMIPKTYEDKRGNTVEYEEADLAMIREDARLRVDMLKQMPGVTLEDVVTDNYVPIEIVADREELLQKLPEELAELAYGMADKEISDVYETEDAFFILDCVARTDRDTTDAAKVAVIEERQRVLFEKEYETWEAETLFKYNYPVWDALQMTEG